MAYDSIRCPRTLNFINLVHMEFKAFLLRDTPSEASVHLFREMFECRQIFPLTCPTRTRGKSSNINKALPGLLLSSIFAYLRNGKCHPTHLRAPKNAWGLLSW